MKTKIIKDRETARVAIRQCGIHIGADYHTLPSGAVERLLEKAKEWGYRKPKNANGSAGRYFHDYLQRLAASSKGVEGLYMQALKKAHVAARERAEAAFKENERKYPGVNGDHHGACGFAWVTFHPARGPFVTFLKKEIKAAGDRAVQDMTHPTPSAERARKIAEQDAQRTFGDKVNYGDGGWQWWAPGYGGQSIDIKELAARAFAEQLRMELEAYELWQPDWVLSVGSRLD